MFDRSDPLILRRSGARRCDQRFAGRIRNQMKMEVASPQRGLRDRRAHGYNQRMGMWTGVEKLEDRPALRSLRPDKAEFDDSQPASAGQSWGAAQQIGRIAGIIRTARHVRFFAGLNS